MTQDSARWQRLAASLNDAALPGVTIVNLETDAFEGGVNYSIGVPRPGGGRVEVSDAWRGDLTTWRGWQVTAENRDGIILRQWPLTKNRGEVADAFKTALSCSSRARRAAGR